MNSEDLAKLEYERLAAEERDRMNGRLQVWTLFLSMVGAFSFIGTQSSNTAYAVALFPWLACCLARHVRHSEDALRQVRKYLYKLEKDASYQGYEHIARLQPRNSHGGYLDALRDALLSTQALALAVVVLHLIFNHLTAFVLPVIVTTSVALFFTTKWLRKC